MTQTPLNAIKTNRGRVFRTVLASYYKVGVYNVFEHGFPAIVETYADREFTAAPEGRVQ